MALCPVNHDNPPSLAYCKECGLPLIELGSEFAQIVRTLRARTVLARPKAFNFLVGIGTVGVKILEQGENLEIRAQINRAACLSIDTGLQKKTDPENGEPVFKLQLGGDGSGDSMFCGRGELVAGQDPSLLPLLKNAGFREKDPNQSALSVMALGGGTASGAASIIFRYIRSLNPESFIFNLVILPEKDESLHKLVNAYYGFSKLLGAPDARLSDAIITIQYERLKKISGVGDSGEELDLEGRLLGFFRLATSCLAFPNSSKFGHLNRCLRSPVLVPCLALGRSLEIYGSLINVLESSLIYPLCPIAQDDVEVSELFLRIPERLSGDFPEYVVAEQLALFNRKHFKNLKYTFHQVCYSKEKHDRMDACLLLGGGTGQAIILDIRKAFEQFKKQAKDSNYWNVYNLTEQKANQAEKSMAFYFPDS